MALILASDCSCPFNPFPFKKKKRPPNSRKNLQRNSDFHKSPLLLPLPLPAEGETSSPSLFLTPPTNSVQENFLTLSPQSGFDPPAERSDLYGSVCRTTVASKSCAFNQLPPCFIYLVAFLYAALGVVRHLLPTIHHAGAGQVWSLSQQRPDNPKKKP